MDFTILVINKMEWKCPTREQRRLLCQCQKAGIQLRWISDWRSFLEEEPESPAMVLTCSDCGILAAGRRKMAALAFVNPYYEKEYGKQDLFGAPVLVENFSGTDVSFLRKVYNRAMGLPLIIGDTKRCRIREISEDDISRLYVLQNGNINKDSLRPMRLEPAEYREYWSAYRREMYGFYGYGLWLIFQNDDIIGMAGFENPQYSFLGEQTLIDAVSCAASDKAGAVCPEMGYWIREEFRGKGYAKEVCEFLLQYAASELEFHEVSVYVEECNMLSRFLAEHLGFRQADCFHQGSRRVLRYTKSLQF